MIADALAAVAATGALAVGDFVNRRVRGWLPDDPPRPGRKQHGRPVPLAGVLLAPALLPWLWPGPLGLLAAVLLATAIGYVDDRGKERGRDLDWRTKAIGLAVAAALAAASFVDPWREPVRFLGAFAWVFVLANATNFLDNMDGVAALLSAVSLFALGADAPAFAALAFVPWNWPRPRLFLGDSGAYCLGILVGAHSATAGSPQLAAVLVQWVDFVQVVVARLWLGLLPWVGDRRHLTHVVHNLGVPRRAIAPLFAAVALLSVAVSAALGPRH